MLLKSVPSSDEDLILSMAANPAHPGAPQHINTITDIANSEPSLLSPHHRQHEQAQHREGGDSDASGDDDDVWADSPSQNPSTPTTTAGHLIPHHHQTHNPAPSHPSDIPRLRQEHVTAGYRDGVTAAKASSAQAGFDEGFGLGAAIGSRAGLLLGLLEGIVAALVGASPATTGPGSAESTAQGGRDGETEGRAGGRGDGGGGGNAPSADPSTDARDFLERARRELSIQSIFGDDYWEPDGTWKYEVGEGGGRATRLESSSDAGDIVFADIAAAHPLLRRWEVLVQEQADRWGIDQSILAREEDVGGVVRDRPETAPTRGEARAVARSREALQW